MVACIVCIAVCYIGIVISGNWVWFVVCFAALEYALLFYELASSLNGKKKQNELYDLADSLERRIKIDKKIKKFKIKRYICIICASVCVVFFLGFCTAYAKTINVTFKFPVLFFSIVFLLFFTLMVFFELKEQRLRNERQDLEEDSH